MCLVTLESDFCSSLQTYISWEAFAEAKRLLILLPESVQISLL